MPEPTDGSVASKGAGAASWVGGAKLAARTLGSFAQIAGDAVAEKLGGALPRTPEQIARPEVINDLIARYTPPGEEPLSRVTGVRIPGVDFESSNCVNFLLELEFDPIAASKAAAAGRALPRTVYVKLPCEELATRSFANTLGFWPLET